MIARAVPPVFRPFVTTDTKKDHRCEWCYAVLPAGAPCVMFSSAEHTSGIALRCVECGPAVSR